MKRTIKKLPETMQNATWPVDKAEFLEQMSHMSMKMHRQMD